MKIRARKSIGISATIIVVIVYALVAMAIAGKYVVGHGMLVELPAFIVLGVGWMPMVMVIIAWMSRPDV
jgi:stage V sporulation protein SpoVS